MKLISADVLDTLNCQDVVCTDICNISFLGHGLIRVTYSSRYQHTDGTPGDIVVSQQVWAEAAFFTSIERASQALMNMKAQATPKLAAAGAVH